MVSTQMAPGIALLAMVVCGDFNEVLLAVEHFGNNVQES